MNNDNLSPDMDKFTEQFKALAGNMELVIQLLDFFPTPIQIFSPDGTCIFINRAFKETIIGDKDGNLVGKYNFNKDPICLKILGQDVYDKVSRGEAVSFPGFPAPISDTLEKGYISQKPYESATMDLFFLPLWDGDTICCTIMFYTVTNMYHGRADIAKAQEYIKQHWLDDFDAEQTARAAHLSKRQFQRIFKEVAGVTPNGFYQNYKLIKIKEKLLDGNLSVEQAFEACGVDSRGMYFRLFKEKNEMTPAEYRKKNGIK
ncbi:MAG: AraC family transcriptional regulator [Defluviitaleaceae bacterium]|nr:AraC family transcriptional regulator [Defluviitaleaceae bacterium]